jgi:hypothetical protein
MTPFHHAESSVKRWGGVPEDYIAIHDWFDETKQYTGDYTHRALRHHSAGIQWAIEKFGHAIKNSKGDSVPVKLIAEQHVQEDCAFIPTPADWLKNLEKKPWMLKVGKTHTVTTLSVTDAPAKELPEKEPPSTFGKPPYLRIKLSEATI